MMNFLWLPRMLLRAISPSAKKGLLIRERRSGRGARRVHVPAASAASHADPTGRAVGAAIRPPRGRGRRALYHGLARQPRNPTAGAPNFPEFFGWRPTLGREDSLWRGAAGIIVPA